MMALQRQQSLWNDVFSLFMLPEEAPWVALAVFGTLAWMPLRNLLLVVRRKLHRRTQRRKQQQHGILKRGGKFSRDDDEYALQYRQTGWSVALFQYLFKYLFGQGKYSQTVAASAPPTGVVSFEQHSDGSVYRQRRLYHPDQIPAETATAQNIMTTPSPTRKQQPQQRRVATPMPKKKKVQLSVSERVEAAATSPYSDNPRLEKENKKPRRDTPHKQPPRQGTPYKQSRQNTPHKPRTAIAEPEIYYRSPSMATKSKRTTLAPKIPAPYLSPVLDHTLAVLENTKQSPSNRKASFLHMPRDPNFLLPYATSKGRSTAAAASQQPRSSSRSSATLKRKFHDDSSGSSSAHHKKDRLTLKRAKRLYSQARAATASETINTPKKRKERRESLLQEFSRKRPKVAPKRNDAPPAVPVSNPFGSAADKKDGDAAKPAFAFGAASKPAGESKPAGGPAFTFGAKPTDAKAPANAVPTPAAKPAFTFGGAVPTIPAADTASVPTPAFAVGAATPSADSLAAIKPAFSFGGGGAPAPATPAAAAPAFAFGGSAAAPAALAAPTGSGGPALSFGGGAPAAAPSGGGGAPAFSFGGGAPAAAAPAVTGYGAAPAFGGAPPATVAPAGFGIPAPPAGGTGFVPARNANRVKKTGGRRRGRA